MEKDIKLLIVPDVHGRDFWRKPIMDNLDKKIVFLGDYLCPYGFEKISDERAIEVFKDILELKKKHKNTITLLLGNHDCTYALTNNICDCRTDYLNFGIIEKLFTHNFDLFDLAYSCIINKRRFLLSHAGFKKRWKEFNKTLFPKGFRVSARAFNKWLHTKDISSRRYLSMALGDVSYYRGGLESDGSIVWADIREFALSSNDGLNFTQIVGHTMLRGKALNFQNKIYCIDCQQVFYIDSNGDVRYYDTDEIVEEVKVE